MLEKWPNGPVYDRENNFELFWQGGPQNITEYTIVKVPTDIPISIRYRKKDSETKFNIDSSEVAPGLWNIEGVISPDICKGLGMPVIRYGDHNEQCYVSDKEVEYLKRFGSVTGNWDSEALKINLIYESQNIKRLLGYLWNPVEVRDNKTHDTLISLDQNLEYYLLPQKRGRPGKREPRSTLRINRL